MTDKDPATTLTDLALLVRRPVLDARRAVHGWELIDRSPTGAGLAGALAHGAPRTDGKPLFLRAGREVLQAAAASFPVPGDIVLQLAAVPGDGETEISAIAQRLHELHALGFRIALDRGALKKAYAEWLALASYVRLDVVEAEQPLLERLLNFVQQRTGAQAIACRVHSQQRFERLAALGVPLFQGNWFAKPRDVPAGGIKPSQAVVIQLMNLLRREADIDEIEPLLKRDPSLSFNLLRAINATGMGLSCEVTSLRHAVMILGQKRLFRWAALLMTQARAAGTAPAVATAAMVRGRLMELLAEELLPREECDNAFVTGVFSLLHVMLDMPMDHALDSLALPQAVADALLRDEGVLAPLLALTCACEAGDEPAFADAAGRLQLSSHQVNWAHLQALAFAQELAQGW